MRGERWREGGRIGGIGLGRGAEGAGIAHAPRGQLLRGAIGASASFRKESQRESFSWEGRRRGRHRKPLPRATQRTCEGIQMREVAGRGGQKMREGRRAHLSAPPKALTANSLASSFQLQHSLASCGLHALTSGSASEEGTIAALKKKTTSRKVPSSGKRSSSESSSPERYS